MTKPPVKNKQDIGQRNPNSFWALPAILVIGTATFGSTCVPGCSETPAEPTLKPVASAEINQSSLAETETSHTQQTPIQPNASGTSEQPHQESDDGVLKKASDLFEQAKSKSGSTASDATRWVQDKIGDAATASGETAEESWKWASDTFESLKSQGLTTANSTSEWLGQDWRNMESWEYKIAKLSGTKEELENQLNELGKQGWECFNIEQHNNETRFFFKKPSFSYLRNLPFKDFIKLVPLMTTGDK